MSARNTETNDASKLLGAFAPPAEASSVSGSSGKHVKVTTYTAGEDHGRLAKAARKLGLENARAPRKPVRALESVAENTELQQMHPHRRTPASTKDVALSMRTFGSSLAHNVGLLFTDSTLEAARMHSVGVMAREEFMTSDGSLHLKSISRKSTKSRRQASRPNYGTLMDVFHRAGEHPDEKTSLEGGALISKREEEEEEEEEMVETVAGGSLTAAVFGIIKGMVGPAVLYLPRGFALSGYAVAVPCLLVATGVYLYSANRLLQVWKVESIKGHLVAEKLEELQKFLNAKNEGDLVPPPKNSRQVSEDYGSMFDGLKNNIVPDEHVEDDLAKSAVAGLDVEDVEIPPPVMLSYPELARRAFGDKGCRVVTLGIALMQFGVCLTYLIFVPNNLHESLKFLFGWNIPMIYLLIGMVAIEIPLSWIRDIRRLTPTNILATLLILYGLSSCLSFALFDSVGKVGDSLVAKFIDLKAFNDTWYLFIGTSVLVFEGSITLLVPLQEAVYVKEDREVFPTMYRKVIMGIIAFYLFFGLTCWASFGDDVRTVLTTSLPTGVLATSVQLAYSIAVMFTFPLQNFPALEVVCQTAGLKAGMEGKDPSLLRRNILASVIVCVLAVIAILTIDSLGNVVSLLGSFLGVPIAFIVPALMHNRLVKDSGRVTRVLNQIVIVLGFIAMFAASFSTLVSWNKGSEGRR